MKQDDYPLSIFREAALSVVGRIGGFVLACGLVSWASAWLVEGETSLEALLWSPVWWFVLVMAGLFQGWGMTSCGALGVIFLFHVHHHKPFKFTYPAAALVQSIESIRLHMNDRTSWSARAIALVVVWALCVAGFTAVSIRELRLRPSRPGHPG